MVSQEQIDHLVTIVNGLPGGRQAAEVDFIGGYPTIHRQGFSCMVKLSNLILLSMAEGLRPLAIPRDGQVDDSITSYWMRHLAASR
ncbi:MAG: hypothetical protein NVS3B29_09000 [Candidatus Saccharimonadales bacterium]